MQDGEKELVRAKEDIKFLLPMAIHLFNINNITEELSPDFYHTLSYEGDIAVAKKIAEIKERYNATP